MKKMPRYTALSLAMLSILYTNNSYAVSTLNDGSFPASTITTTSDDIIINTTTDGSVNPQIVATTGDGLSASNSKQLTVNSSNVFGISSNASGNYNTFYGIRAANGGVVTANADININMNSGTGVYIANEGNTTFNNRLDIVSTGQSMGIRGYSSSTTGANGEFKDVVTISSAGDDSYGIYSQIVNPNGAAPKLTFGKNVSIAMNGNDSVGVMVEDASSGSLNSGLIHFEDGLDINMVAGTAVLSLQDNHKIQIDGPVNLVSQNKAYNVLESQAGNIEINGKANLDGNIEAAYSGRIDLNFSAGSIVKGMMNNYVDPTNPLDDTAGIINVNFDGAGNSWTMTDSSSINSLAGQGNIIFDNYTTGMLLSITDANGTTGNHTVEVVDSGNNDGDAADGATIITTQGGSGSFSMSNLANIGAYQYGITQVGNDWQLSRTNSFSLTTNNAINGLRAGYLMNYNENQSLLQRMGELRQSASDGDVWVKLLAGKNKVDGNSQLSGFDQKFYGLQVGGDRKYILDENADVYLGLAFGYTHSDQDYERGDGNIDSYYINAYGTYANVNGLYVDNVFKLGRQKQDFSLQDNQNNSVNGDTNSMVIGLSSEVGYKYYFLDEQKTGWFTQPSAQLSYSRVSSDSFTASNDQNINFDSYTSILGKAGIMVGYDFSQSENPANFYVKTNYFHEFDGDLSGKINNETIKTDLGSNWWSYGAGFNMQIENLHNVYFDIEQSRGADFKQLWKLNVGYRYTW